MITKIIMHHSSEGVSVKEVLSRLTKLGFKASLGLYDYQYDWQRNVTSDDVLELVDNVIETLRGCKVYFHFTTG